MNVSEACNVSTDLSKDVGFITEMTIVLILAPVGCFLNVCSIYSILKTTLFHTNLRILLSHLSFLSCFYCTAAFGKYFYVAVALAANPCVLVTNVQNCKVQELVNLLPLLTSVYSLIGIGVERIYATVYYKTYEQKNNFPLSFLIIVFIWTISLSTQIVPLPTFPKSVYLPVCQSLLASNKEAALLSICLALIFELASIVMFICTTLIDKKRSEAFLISTAMHTSTLTGRFQLSENMEMNKVMLPTAVAHCLFYLLTSVVALLVVVGTTDDWLWKIRLAHLNIIGVELYAIGGACIIFGRNERLRQQLVKLFPLLLKFNRIKPGAGQAEKKDSDKHFAYLDKIWSKNNAQ